MLGSSYSVSQILVCERCSTAHGVKVLGLVDPTRTCEACGVATLDRLRVLDEADRRLVTPINATCRQCRRPWRIFPYEFAAQVKQGDNRIERKCPHCRFPFELTPAQVVPPIEPP